MQDLWHQITNRLDHNRGSALGIGLGIIVVLGAFFTPGCLEPKTRSLKDSTVQVTEIEFLVEAKEVKNTLLAQMGVLSVEMDAMEKEVLLFETRTDIGLADIEDQRAGYVTVLETLEAISMQAAAGTLNPVAFIPAAFGIAGLLFGVGKGYDNRRKDALITELKNGNKV